LELTCHAACNRGGSVSIYPLQVTSSAWHCDAQQTAGDSPKVLGWRYDWEPVEHGTPNGMRD
jgi:hypothetical protein